jgi:hypothetical protein
MLCITNQIIEFIGTTLPKTAILLMANFLVFCANNLRKPFENMCAQWKLCSLSKNFANSESFGKSFLY